MNRKGRRTVSAYVDVDLSEFDEDDLIDELESAGYTVVPKNFDLSDFATKMYMALSKRDQAEVSRLAAMDLYDRFGKIV